MQNNPLLMQQILNNMNNVNMNQVAPREALIQNLIARNGLLLNSYDTPTNYQEMSPEQRTYAQDFWRMNNLQGAPTVNQLIHQAQILQNPADANFEERLINNQLQQRGMLKPGSNY